MRLTLPLLAVVLSLSTPAVAQLGIYGTFDAERVTPPGNSVIVSGSLFPGTGTSASTTASTPIPASPIGGTGGIYYDFRNVGPVRLGADLRGSILTSTRGIDPYSSGSGIRVNSVLGGVRGTFHTRYDAVRPYVELAAGLGRTNYGLFGSGTDGQQLYNAFQFQGFAGVDIRLSSAFDFRALELGYGGLTSTGPASGTGVFQLKSLGVGVVFHLPSLP